MDFTYKPILQNFQEDLAIPMVDWTSQTMNQVQRMHSNMMLSNFINRSIGSIKSVDTIANTRSALLFEHDTGKVEGLGGLLGTVGSMFWGSLGVTAAPAAAEENPRDLETPRIESYSGEKLFQASAFPVSLLEELEMIAQFDSTLSDDANRLPIYRNVVAYVEDIVRHFLVYNIPDSVREAVFLFAPSQKALDLVSQLPQRMSMGVVAQWCRMIDAAIRSEHEEVSAYYLTKVGRLDIFFDQTFSAMLNAFCPHRNDVVHTRASNRDPNEIVPLAFGHKFFHDWWYQEGVCLTPLTKALEGHVTLRLSVMNSRNHTK